MTKKYKKWNDYERSMIIMHYKKFCLANRESLWTKIPGHSIGSINCEISRYDNWLRTGVLEFEKAKTNNLRPGSVEKYIRIINDLL